MIRGACLACANLRKGGQEVGKQMQPLDQSNKLGRRRRITYGFSLTVLKDIKT